MPVERFPVSRHYALNGPVQPGPVNLPFDPRRYFQSTEGLVYCSDMRLNYGAKEPISDERPTGSRVSAEGLVLSWDGHSLRDGKAKNFADPSGATDGTLNGEVTVGGATGIRGAATLLDGVDDKITFSGITFPDQFTARILFNRKVTTTTEHIIELAGGHIGIYLRSEGNAQLRNGGGGMPVSTNYSNLWSCPAGIREIVVVIDKTNGKYAIWQDGVFIESANGTFGAFSLNTCIIGPNDASWPQMDILEVEVWSGIKSNTEVRQLYEDTYGWVENKANPHCKDISDAYPLGSDRVSSEGLVLALDMETLTEDGKLKDFSGQGNHATVTGAKYQRSGVKNGEYKFSSASGDQVTFVAPIPGDFSASLFVKVTANTANASASQVLFDLRKMRYMWFNYYEADYASHPNEVGLSWNDGSGNHTIFAPLTVGESAHFAITFDGTTVTLYKNGVAASSAAYPVAVSATTSGFSPVVNYYADMLAMGCQIFDRALSPAEVEALYLDGQKMLGLVQGGASDIERQGQVGKAVDLNGTSQYVEVADCPALQITPNVTMGAWVNADADEPMRHLGKFGTQGYFIYNSDATQYVMKVMGTGGTTIYANSPAKRAKGRWQLVTMTYDNSVVRAFVDGDYMESVVEAGKLGSDTTPFRVGTYGTIQKDYMDGRIAFPFIFSRALSAAEIARLHRIGRTGGY